MIERSSRRRLCESTLRKRLGNLVVTAAGAQRDFFLYLLTSLVALLLWSPIALAHGGGTPRLTDVPAGPYRLYAWTQPEPLRAGEVHVTIGVTLADSQAATTAGGDLVQPVTDATVTLRFIPPSNHESAAIERVATVGGVGAVYYEADASLLTAGTWQFIIDVQGDAGAGQAEFTEVLLPMRSVNWTLLGAGGGAFVLLIVLIALWNRRQPAAVAKEIA